MDDNKRFLDHLGVTAWHAAGWTGSRGLTATGEELGEQQPCEKHGRGIPADCAGS